MSSEPADAVPARSFRFQLQEAFAWLKGPGGLIVGDFNRIPCCKWRVAEKELGRDDKILRKVTGFTCSCCQGDMSTEVPFEIPAYARIVTQGVEALAKTHWCWQGDEWKGQSWQGNFKQRVPVARLDFAIEVGVKQEWSNARREWPSIDGALSSVCVSDHALVGFSRGAREAEHRGTERPMPSFSGGTRST